MRRGLRFGLLGAPVLYDFDVPNGRTGNGIQPIGGAKVRTLLAALLLEPGRVVPVEALKDALWGGTPPASAQASLHNHVARLRRRLDDPSRLRAVPPGYLLRVGPGELDVHVFQAHVARARAAHANEDWRRVLGECASALALWRGTPPPETVGYAFTQRLTEAHRLLLDWRYDAELQIGGPRIAALVPELTALTAEHPLRESYHRQLMLALHRTGRRAESLAVHRDLRNRLLEELGVEPGAGVQAAHVEVLRVLEGAMPTDLAVPYVPAQPTSGSSPRPAPALTPRPELTPLVPVPTPLVPASTPQVPSAPAPSLMPQPAQLPPPPTHFTGRTSLAEALRRTLAPERRTGTDYTPVAPVAVIHGMPGVGKSALALYVAHALRDRFPDGQLYVDLHGTAPGAPPLTPAQALTALLRHLGAEPLHTPEHPDAAAALLRSLLAPTRTLMVLDDAEGAAQVRPLLPAGSGCAVIVTSGSPLTALDGARRFPVTPLTANESAELLRAVSGRDGLHATHPLVELTARLPLALRVVAARLAARRALTPDLLAGQLAAAASRLPYLEYDDLSVRRSLAGAHDALRASAHEADRDAALALSRIGTLDLPSYDIRLLARLTATDERRAEAALDRLTDVALLEETAYGHYAPHDLVRDFARELAAAEAAGEVAAEAAANVPTAGRRG